MSDKRTPVAGTFLIASPGLVDPNFFRSVVLIINNDEKGTLGVIVNRRTDVEISKVVAEPAGLCGRLHLGGPVQTDGLFILHRFGEELPGSMSVGSGIFFGGDLDCLERLSDPGPTPSSFRGYVGCAGWGPKQLEGELDQGSWILCRANEYSVFEVPSGELWSTLLASLGGRYLLYSMIPPDVQRN